MRKPIVEMSDAMIQYYKRKAKLAEATKKRKEEVKREFEEYLRESMNGLHEK